MYQCPESGSGALCFWASWIRNRIRLSVVQIRGSGSVPKCHGSSTLLLSLLVNAVIAPRILLDETSVADTDPQSFVNTQTNQREKSVRVRIRIKVKFFLAF
jgi:hypothetical protein